jgi:hypothetical protein
MSSERLQLLGRLEEQTLKARKTKLKLAGLVHSLRQLLDGYAPVEILEGEVIAQQAVELAATQALYREMLELIAAIKRDLGQ